MCGRTVCSSREISAAIGGNERVTNQPWQPPQSSTVASVASQRVVPTRVNIGATTPVLHAVVVAIAAAVDVATRARAQPW